MLEIILLIFLARRVGAKAVAKGEPKGRWQLYLVLAWIGFEITGAMIGYMISRNIVSAAVLGIACAAGSYLLIKYKLDQLPDKQDTEDWMDRLGRQDNP